MGYVVGKCVGMCYVYFRDFWKKGMIVLSIYMCQYWLVNIMWKGFEMEYVLIELQCW